MFLKRPTHFFENGTWNGLDQTGTKIKPGPEVKTQTGSFSNPDWTGKIETRTRGNYPNRQKENPYMDRTGLGHP